MNTISRFFRQWQSLDWTAVFLFPFWLVTVSWLAVICTAGFFIGWKFIGPVLGW